MLGWICLHCGDVVSGPCPREACQRERQKVWDSINVSRYVEDTLYQVIHDALDQGRSCVLPIHHDLHT